MATTLSGWKCLTPFAKKGDLVVWKETFTFGTGTTDVYGTEFGIGADAGETCPRPPAGVDFEVLFVQNATMSTAGDIVVKGSMIANQALGSKALLKDDHIAYAANSTSVPQATAATYVVNPMRSSRTGPEMRVYQLWLDADGAHSASTGTDKDADLYVSWVVPE